MPKMQKCKCDILSNFQTMWKVFNFPLATIHCRENVMVTLIFFHTIADPNWISFRHFSQFCEEEEERQRRRPQLLGEKQFARSIQAWKNVPFHISRCCLFLKDIILTGICFAMDRLIAFYFERVAVKLSRAARGFLFYIAIKNRQKSHFLLLGEIARRMKAL